MFLDMKIRLCFIPQGESQKLINEMVGYMEPIQSKVTELLLSSGVG